MKKKYILISALYAFPSLTKVHVNEPITLEIPLLGTFDHSGLVKVEKIAEFRSKVDMLINHGIKSKGEAYTLEDFVHFEKSGELDSEHIKKLFDMYTKKFLQMSHSYFNGIRDLKQGLVKILAIWANQRNRNDSLVLLWASIENGKEEEFIKEYTPTLEAFYTFLVDIDMLLLDIMHSCPKSYAKYLEAKKIIEEQHHS
ncbi:MAG: hypothetical protein K2X90_04250 [Candidatus Babeliaceae bacterium]|nr:hypothetical protein [Candidatus Babeliaceae bacterium]